MNTICATHNQEFDKFCVDHNTCCCVFCTIIGQHDGCRVLPLEKVTQNIKFSVPSVKDRLRYMTQEFQAIETFLFKMKSSIDDQRKQCMEQKKYSLRHFGNEHEERNYN